MKLFPDPLDNNYLIHLSVNLYASKALWSVLKQNLPLVLLSMRSLIYINRYIEM